MTSEILVLSGRALSLDKCIELPKMIEELFEKTKKYLLGYAKGYSILDSNSPIIIFDIIFPKILEDRSITTTVHISNGVNTSSVDFLVTKSGMNEYLCQNSKFQPVSEFDFENYCGGSIIVLYSSIKDEFEKQKIKYSEIKQLSIYISKESEELVSAININIVR